ncbi:FAD:protein FMN transferase [Lacisediminihabitans sp.]|uniref:FAD:protein FMN transferase n=1 Tax=Lacisediminihabitans sp. TaxID=2787631 RepID=UPI00374CD985
MPGNAADWPVWSMTARVVVTEPQHLERAVEITRLVLDEVDAACSRFRADSELARLSEDLPNGVEVSGMLAVLVREALHSAEITDGDVDPTLGNELASLGYDRDIALVADRSFGLTVTRVAIVPGWRRVLLDGRRLTVPSDLALDLGATAKAFAADLAAARVVAELPTGVLVSLGGDIATAGESPAGGWVVLVQDLPADPRATVTLAAGFALATSSTQKRQWTRAGERMHHILDPRLGRPAEPVWRSATVSARSCVEANTVSTACIVRGHRALELVRDRGLPARLVDREARVVTLGGWPAEAGTEGVAQ